MYGPRCRSRNWMFRLFRHRNRDGQHIVSAWLCYSVWITGPINGSNGRVLDRDVIAFGLVVVLKLRGYSQRRYSVSLCVRKKTVVLCVRNSSPSSFLTSTCPERMAGWLVAPCKRGTPLGPVPIELIRMVKDFSLAGAMFLFFIRKDSFSCCCMLLVCEECH